MKRIIQTSILLAFFTFISIISSVGICVYLWKMDNPGYQLSFRQYFQRLQDTVMVDGNIDYNIIDAAAVGNLKEVKRFIEEEGVDVNFYSKSLTPLNAALTGYPFIYDVAWDPSTVAEKSVLFKELNNVVTYLLQKGADPELTVTLYGGSDTITPLQIATQAGNMQGIVLLLEHGIDINQSNPFDKAELSLPLIEMLVYAGADTGKSKVLLKRAAYEGRLDIIKFLVQHGATVDISVLQQAQQGYQSNIKWGDSLGKREDLLVTVQYLEWLIKSKNFARHRR